MSRQTGQQIERQDRFLPGPVDLPLLDSIPTRLQIQLQPQLEQNRPAVEANQAQLLLPQVRDELYSNTHLMTDFIHLLYL